MQRIIVLFLLAVLTCQTSSAQNEPMTGKDLTGLWKGTLYNDSTGLYHPFELAISENKGKLTGYSETIFYENGKEEIGIRSVKIRTKEDKIIVEDVSLIANTYSIPPPKGVKKLLVLSYSENDTARILSGKWSTNRTKIYLPATGIVEVHRKQDFKSTALFKKLVELKLDDELSFNPKEKQPEPEMVVVLEKEVTETPVKKEKPKKEKKPEVKPEPEVAVTPVIVPPAADIATRKITSIQSVEYESDSLVLTLYDNGDVDGDTVSIAMNGKLIFSKQGLTTKASSKTIYVNELAADSIQLIMYAENLGSIPPNTGLLVVSDGEKRYDVRFSADLQSNAAIILRRKKK